MTEVLNIAVIGTGALGREHARIYSELASEGLVNFAGIYDIDPSRARSIADKHNTRVFGTLEEAVENCDAASIVTPTNTHFEVARAFLEHSRHVLIEKPMTDSGEQASALVELSRKNQCVLQVGHVERFNPIFTYLESAATNPRFIEVHRLSPFPSRSTDIGVVLDLMIHDLDIVLAFVKSPVSSVDAVGVPVLSDREDIANARIRFENGCVANLTASRISSERMRKIRVFSGGPATSYISLDYRAQEGYIFRLAEDTAQESSFLRKLLSSKSTTIISEYNNRKIIREPVPITHEEPLRLELRSFVECIQTREKPVVSGESAMRALDLAFWISKEIESDK